MQLSGEILSTSSSNLELHYNWNTFFKRIIIDNIVALSPHPKFTMHLAD